MERLLPTDDFRISVLVPFSFSNLFGVLSFLNQPNHVLRDISVHLFFLRLSRNHYDHTTNGRWSSVEYGQGQSRGYFQCARHTSSGMNI